MRPKVIAIILTLINVILLMFDTEFAWRALNTYYFSSYMYFHFMFVPTYLGMLITFIITIFLISDIVKNIKEINKSDVIQYVQILIINHSFICISFGNILGWSRQ